MNPIMETLMLQKLERTAENLRRNHMEAVIAENKEDALAKLRGYLFENCVIGCGGSATLDEIGALPLFRSGRYRFLDRYEKGLTPAQIKQIYRDSLSADVYVMSTNAVTETGALYNVDGRANRVAALLYGPDSVVVIAGYNKITANVEEAIRRVKTVAAPANAMRLHCEVPCARTGKCVSLLRGDEPELCEGCSADDRICASYVVCGRQREKNRIKVILVKEALGF